MAELLHIKPFRGRRNVLLSADDPEPPDPDLVVIHHGRALKTKSDDRKRVACQEGKGELPRVPPLGSAIGNLVERERHGVIGRGEGYINAGHSCLSAVPGDGKAVVPLKKRIGLVEVEHGGVARSQIAADLQTASAVVGDLPVKLWIQGSSAASRQIPPGRENIHLAAIVPGFLREDDPIDGGSVALPGVEVGYERQHGYRCHLGNVMGDPLPGMRSLGVARVAVGADPEPVLPGVEGGMARGVGVGPVGAVEAQADLVVRSLREDSVPVHTGVVAVGLNVHACVKLVGASAQRYRMGG